MTNITATEWADTEAKLAAALAVRWPWLHDSELRVKSPIMTAHAEARWSLERTATVRITVDSSSCILGGILEITNATRILAEVRDAMLFVHGETSDLTIWRDGECPCGYCGAKGTSRGAKCDRCKGTGKR